MSDLVRWLRNQWDRATAVVLVAVAALLFLLGWLGISDALLVTQQIPYLASAGLFGLLALGVGATLWLSADLRDEWRKLDEISSQLGDAVAALNAGESRGRAGAGNGVRTAVEDTVRDAVAEREAPRRAGVGSAR